MVIRTEFEQPKKEVSFEHLLRFFNDPPSERTVGNSIMIDLPHNPPGCKAYAADALRDEAMVQFEHVLINDGFKINRRDEEGVFYACGPGYFKAWFGGSNSWGTRLIGGYSYSEAPAQEDPYVEFIGERVIKNNGLMRIFRKNLVVPVFRPRYSFAITGDLTYQDVANMSDLNFDIARLEGLGYKIKVISHKENERLKIADEKRRREAEEQRLISRIASEAAHELTRAEEIRKAYACEIVPGF